MLAASWAHRHTPWLSVGRRLYQWRFVTRSVTLQLGRLNYVDDAATADRQIQALPVGKEVFEEPSKDYSSVLADSIAPSPSVLQMVEATLPITLPQTIPSDLIFEEESDDYVTYPPQKSMRLPTDRLVQLVQDEEYADAYHLLSELKELSVNIPPSEIYEKAANACLRSLLTPSNDVPSKEQEERFIAWFSLIPPLHFYKSHIPTFPETRRLIFQSPVTNLNIVAQTATILSSKGFADVISNKAIPLVLRFASSDVGIQFLENFEKANKEYWLDHDPAQAEYMTRKVSTNVRGAAIRSLAHAGRFDIAISLLPDPETDMFRLTKYTYDVLLRRLSASSDNGPKKYIPLIQNIIKNSSIVIVDAVEDPSSTMAQDAELLSNPEYAPPIRLGDNLVSSLRCLKNALGRRGSAPHPFTILSFIEAYHAIGRSRALTVLLNRAIRSSYAQTSSFIFAEMLYYYRRQQHHLVIETFVDHCYLSGIPRTDIVSYYTRCQHIRENHNPDDAKDTLPSRIHYSTNVKRFDSRMKLWPAAVHCNLVWHSLATLAPHDLAVERLYNKLLEILTEGKEDSQSAYFSQIPALALSPGWKKGPSGAAFTPFMRRLMLAHGPARGVRVMGDMLKLGMKPTLYHLTELAGQYARTGDASRALLILGKMEANLEKVETAQAKELIEEESQDEASLQDVDVRSSRNGELSFLSPDLVMYISLMRGFIISKDVKAAEEVNRRLRLKHTYRLGEDQFLDGVYEDLYLLKQELGHTMIRKSEDREGSEVF